MATLNLGRIKPVFRGAYSGGTAYVVDDIVTHGNESFICIQAHGAGTQATSVTAYWTKLAAKGTDGTDVGTTITTQGDVLYRDGSGLQRLAKPASTQVLQNTSGGVLSWVTPSAGKTLQIARVDAASVTSDSSTASFSSGAYPDDGTAHCTIAFTPVSATSILVVNAEAPSGVGGNGIGAYAIFAGSACKAHGLYNGYSSDSSNATLSASWVSGTTSAVSIQYRTVGSWGGDAHVLGRRRGATTNAVTPYGSMVVQEIQP